MKKVKIIQDRVFNFSWDQDDLSLSVVETSPSEEPISFKTDPGDFESLEIAERAGIKLVELRISFRKQNPLDP